MLFTSTTRTYQVQKWKQGGAGCAQSVKNKRSRQKQAKQNEKYINAIYIHDSKKRLLNAPFDHICV